MSDEQPLVFAVDDKGRVGYAPPERPATSPVQGAVRSRTSKAQEAYDEKRRPQAALLFRFIREKRQSGRSWRECWALGEGNEGWDVGPIVIWMRSRGVDIEALYDPIAGETRFYLR